MRCLLDDKGEKGEALHAIYNDEDTAPDGSPEVFYEEMPDGSVLTWEGGTFVYRGAGGAEFSITGNDVTVKGNLIVDQDLTVKGASDLKSATKIQDIVQSGN